MPIHPKKGNPQKNKPDIMVLEKDKRNNKKKNKKRSDNSDTEDPTVTWYNDTLGYQKNQGQSVLVTYNASDYGSQV